MRVFVAGASGVVGKHLVPLLVDAGHHVIATTRTPMKIDELRLRGAIPVLMDGLDRNAVMKAMESSRPDVVVNEMTAITSLKNLKGFDATFARTNSLRTEGTEYLLAAAAAVGAKKFIAQSYTGWPNERRGGWVKSEDDPLDFNPPPAMRESLEAIRFLERSVLRSLGVTGVVLRYGSFYGPGTSLSFGGETVELVRQRKLPIVGKGMGVWSFLHIDDAAAATLIAIESEAAGLFNIVDDDPAPVSEWLPELARVVGAKPPLHIPVWLGRLLVGDAGVEMMTNTRGSSNAKARITLSWKPVFSSWREGFQHGLAARAEHGRFARAS